MSDDDKKRVFKLVEDDDSPPLWQDLGLHDIGHGYVKADLLGAVAGVGTYLVLPAVGFGEPREYEVVAEQVFQITEKDA